MLQIAEPGFHQHAPVGTTRHDARRGLAGAAATKMGERNAGRLRGRFEAVMQNLSVVHTVMLAGITVCTT
ncbi:hypothetical protein, partial [Burkholderia territorii]|uniref:hypothetical protein n=1 Tax=Burkholderia territorii TaxID=1503055 RepID=UPI001BA44862